MANIRNSRRNYARPSNTFSLATSYASASMSNASITSSISATKLNNVAGVNTTNRNYTLTSDPAGINASLVTNSTTGNISFGFASPSQTYSIIVTDSNYNGPGKPVTAPNTVTSPAYLTNAAVLLIGGGGGGGMVPLTDNARSGGGGAGAYREFQNFNMLVGTSFTCIIGAGGTGGSSSGQRGLTGSSSQITTILAGGGGGGGAGISNVDGVAGSSGGSGGGAGNNVTTTPRLGGPYVAPTFFSGKDLHTVSGFAGGAGGSSTTNCGGGGGAVGAGASNASAPGGGNGRTSSISGSSTTRGGGGGGGAGGSGGAGGGGNAGNNAAGNAGGANTGGGGGGCKASGVDARVGGNGGSGVIIIKIPDTHTLSFSDLTTSVNTSVVGFNIYSITAGNGTATLAEV